MRTFANASKVLLDFNQFTPDWVTASITFKYLSSVLISIHDNSFIKCSTLFFFLTKNDNKLNQFDCILVTWGAWNVWGASWIRLKYFTQRLVQWPPWIICVLSHSFNWFVQKHWLIQEQKRDCLYKWVTKLLIEPIHSKTLIHSGSKQGSHWIIDCLQSSLWLLVICFTVITNINM